MANRESRSSWRDFLLGLKMCGLHGVEFVVADDHAGLRAALREVLAERPTSAVRCTFWAIRSTACRAASTTTVPVLNAITASNLRRGLEAPTGDE
jgi:putative transposase